MRITYDNILVASFVTWFDNVLSNNGQAFFNTPALLYPMPSDYYKSENIYSSPFRPWIYDNSLSGVQIPSGVFDANGNFLTRESGIYINFEKGYIGSTVGPLAYPLSGNISVKEFDIFYTNEDEDVFLSQTKFVKKPQTTLQIPWTGLGENQQTFPCCAIKYDPGMNKDWAFGGTQNTVSEFRVLVVASNSFYVDAVCSIFRDTRHANFSLLYPENLPFNSFGDYKSGIPYNYQENITSDPESMIWIKDVNSLKLSDAASIRVGQKLYTAMIDFVVERPRNLNLQYIPGTPNLYYILTEDGDYRITE